MPKVHLSGQNRNIPAHALNAPIKNTFEQRNIRFHVDGHYLTDMSDKGIEKFIKKHVNSKSGFLGGIGIGWGGKDLDVKEVKAFLQAVAANADKMENFTFDLKDPELGLYDDDDITLKDIQHSFHLNYEPSQGSSNTSVSFVDATGVQSDYQQAKGYETKTHDDFKSIQKTHRTLQSDLQSAQRARDRIAQRIGDKASQQLLEVDNRLGQVNDQIQSLTSQLDDIRNRLKDNSLPQDQKQEMRLMARGMDLELKELKSEQKDLKAQLDDNHGFWSFLGGGSSLEDLREANAQVEKAQQALNDNKAVYDQARSRWQEAVSQREAVENGESWADVHGADEAPAAPATPATPQTPAGQAPATPPADAPQGEDTPITSIPVTQPTAPVTAPANGNTLPVATEQTLQNLLTLPAAEQLDALAQVPAEQRDLFLKMADDYWVGGQEGNVFGLSAADFEAMKGLQEPVAQLRLNALLSWGEETQNTYLSTASDRTKQDIQAHLNQQLFDQQLTQQADALKAKLSGGQSPAAPVSQAPETPQAPAETPAPTTPPAEQTIQTGANPQMTTSAAAQPVAAQGTLPLDAYATLSPDQKLDQFRQLNAADQQTVFQAADAIGKVKVMATLLTQGESPATVQGLAEQMSTTDRSLAIHELSTVLAQTTGPAPQKTELNMVLGMLRQLNGVSASAPTPAPTTPVPTPATQPETTPVAPETVEPERPGFVVEDPNGAAPTPGITLMNTRDEAPTTEPAVAPSAADTPVAPANNTAEPAVAPAASTVDEDVAMGQALLSQLATLAQTATPENPAHLQAFAGLSTEDKTLVFKVASADIQAELMFAMGEADQTAERQAVLGALNDAQRGDLAKLFSDILPNFGPEDQEMSNAIRQFLTDLGHAPDATGAAAPAAAPVAASTERVDAETEPFIPPAATGGGTLGDTPAITPDASLRAQTTTPTANPVVGDEPGRLDTTLQLNQLKQELNNTSWMGGLMNNSKANALIDQIWDRGTHENRTQLAHLLVTEDQSDKLSNLLVDYDHSFEKMASMITTPNFPVKEFMGAIENDDRAGLILSNMSELAMQDNALGQASRQFVMKALEEYKDGIDREGPIEFAKQNLQNMGLWDQIPAALTKEMEHILDTIWN